MRGSQRPSASPIKHQDRFLTKAAAIRDTAAEEVAITIIDQISNGPYQAAELMTKLASTELQVAFLTLAFARIAFEARRVAQPTGCWSVPTQRQNFGYQKSGSETDIAAVAGSID